MALRARLCAIRWIRPGRLAPLFAGMLIESTAARLQSIWSASLKRCNSSRSRRVGYLPISRTGAVLFFQLMSRRYEHASTVLTSNKGFEEWGEVFGDEVMAAALIDRLEHHCHIVNIRGNSYRMRHHAELYRALGTSRDATRPDTPARSRTRAKEAAATWRLAPTSPQSVLFCPVKVRNVLCSVGLLVVRPVTTGWR
jgi:hypothetical protein